MATHQSPQTLLCPSCTFFFSPHCSQILKPWSFLSAVSNSHRVPELRQRPVCRGPQALLMLSQCKINNGVWGTHTQGLMEIKSQRLKKGSERDQARITDPAIFAQGDIHSKPTEIPHIVPRSETDSLPEPEPHGEIHSETHTQRLTEI